MDSSNQQKYVVTVPVTAPPKPSTGVPQSHVAPQVVTPWSTGLCDCVQDVSNCCITCWCPCITFGKISDIISQGSSSCITNGALYGLLMCFTGCGCLISCCYRSKMRRQYLLPGSNCEDFCLHCWCECCALCQEYRELKNRGFDMNLGWQENEARMTGQGTVQMAPTTQHGMTR